MLTPLRGARMGPEFAETVCSALLIKAEHHAVKLRATPAWDQLTRKSHQDEIRACWEAFRTLAPRSHSYGAAATTEFFTFCADCQLGEFTAAA